MWIAAPLALALVAAPPPPAVHGARVPIELSDDTLQAVLAGELRRSERDVLDDFQIVCAKYHRGRVVLTDVAVAPTDDPERMHVRVDADLVFDRRQLGVKWRGLKSRKKWYDKGRERVARVRITGELEVRPTLDVGLGVAAVEFRLTRLRARVESRLKPLRGLAVRFPLPDRTERWDLGDVVPNRLRRLQLTSLDVRSPRRDVVRIDLGVSWTARTDASSP